MEKSKVVRIKLSTLKILKEIFPPKIQERMSDYFERVYEYFTRKKEELKEDKNESCPN